LLSQISIRIHPNSIIHPQILFLINLLHFRSEFINDYFILIPIISINNSKTFPATKHNLYCHSKFLSLIYLRLASIIKLKKHSEITKNLKSAQIISLKSSNFPKVIFYPFTQKFNLKKKKTNSFGNFKFIFFSL
jgi:hypothetical protein